ncbi:hypothetical protein OR1_04190 [Geobacter sp. OR-1]|nr:hypothetical protein OR1_04190 [Geobacter sp. OR-1]
MPSYCILEVSWFTFSRYRVAYPLDKPQLVMKMNNLKQLRYSILATRLHITELVMDKIKNNNRYIDWWDGNPKKEKTDIFDPSSFKIEDMKQTYPKLEAGIENNLLQYYKDIIDMCKKNNIKLILYTAPEAPIYISYQKDKNKVKSVILNSALQNNLEYYDFTPDGQYYSDKLDQMLFDSHHVRKQIEFTKYFVSVLREKNTF